MTDFFEDNVPLEIKTGGNWPIMIPAKVLDTTMTPVHITIVVMIYSFNGQEIDWDLISARCERTSEEIEEMVSQMHDWGIFWK